MTEYVNMKLQKNDPEKSIWGKMAKLLIALFICFTLTLMVNFEFGKDWSTVTTILKLSDYKKGQISLNRSANSELAEFLDQETSGSLAE